MVLAEAADDAAVSEDVWFEIANNKLPHVAVELFRFAVGLFSQTADVLSALVHSPSCRHRLVGAPA